MLRRHETQLQLKDAGFLKLKFSFWSSLIKNGYSRHPIWSWRWIESYLIPFCCNLYSTHWYFWVKNSALFEYILLLFILYTLIFLSKKIRYTWFILLLLFILYILIILCKKPSHCFLFTLDTGVKTGKITELVTGRFKLIQNWPSKMTFKKWVLDIQIWRSWPSKITFLRSCTLFRQTDLPKPKNNFSWHPSLLLYIFRSHFGSDVGSDVGFLFQSLLSHFIHDSFTR